MTLAFVNPSRSFDEARNAVRFIGHDGMFEVRFFVEADALAGPATGTRATGASETACLAAFDAARDSIRHAASKAYSQGRRNPCILTSADLR